MRAPVSAQPQSEPRRPAYAPLGAAIVGTVGFFAGFFFPLIVNPDANQGPLVGIFITGPGGALLGFVAGALLTWWRASWQRFLLTSAALAAVLAAGTLLFAFPEPISLGTLVEADVVRCERAEQHVDAAVAEWKRQLAQGYIREPRSGWDADVPELLRREPGAVLILRVTRRVHITEHQKPWNRGRLTRREQAGDGEQAAYYWPGAAPDCSGELPARLRFSPQWHYTLPLPPDNAPGFLRLTAIGELSPTLERALAATE